MSHPELPHNIEAEKATLGSILLNREAIVAVAPWLQMEYFYMERHALLYEAMLTCYNARIPPDTRTVSEELRRRDRLEAVGGIPYLSDLVDTVPTSYHVEYYARIVERTALLRKLIGAGGKIAAFGYDEQEELDVTLDKAEQTLFEVSQRRTTQDFVHIGQVIDQYYEQINYLQEHRGEVVGVPTGFRDLDEITGGLQRSDLLILAARPGVGKTSFVLSLAYNIATRHQRTVGVFSLEMSRDQLVQRLLAMDTRIDTHRLRTGHLNEADLQTVMEAMGRLASVPIYIEDTPGMTIMEVRSKARRLQSQAGVDLIIIDYLQLMSGRRSDNRVQEVSEISRGLKALARELNVPVIALSQLSRAVEGRTSHVPMLSDLRESGCLAGETLIYLPDEGTYRRIDELVGRRNFNVLALNTETSKLEPHPVTNAFATGLKPVYRMKTRLGRVIRATANHKFLTIQGWKRLDELAPKMRLALPRILPSPTLATMSESKLALLGHLIGDGCTLPRQPSHYTTNDLTLAETVAMLAVEAFGDTVKPRISKERQWYQVYLAAAYRLTHGVRNPIAKWLNELGVFGLRSFVIPAMQIAGITTRQMQAGLGNAYCGTGLYKQNLSRERADRLAQIVASDELWKLANSDIYWDEIVSIEPDGEAEVYDLTVEGLHNFVANDFIAHNSIEQDADIVMFIYREELYEKETDKKGIAELHIAKHRNGPVGVVPMRFDAATTRFDDLTYRTPEGY